MVIDDFHLRRVYKHGYLGIGIDQWFLVSMSISQPSISALISADIIWLILYRVW